MRPGDQHVSVVVTGIGLMTGLGVDRETSWSAIRSGRTALGWIDSKLARRGLDRPASAEDSPHAAGVVCGPMHDAWEHLDLAGWHAMADAGLTLDSDFNRDRAAVIVGMSKGDLSRLAHAHRSLLLEGPGTNLLGSFFRRSLPDFAAGSLSRGLNLRGPSLAPIAACATGVIAALRGADLIRQGDCDLAVVGAGDASVHPLVLGAFRNMKVLAKIDGDPASAVRPWDNDRSGFLPGEGAAVLVLERADHAKARRALPYAEFAGGAFGSDAYHITNLNPDPSGLAHLIGLALRNAEMQPADLDHINVHGTATRQNDPLECRAIRKALGPHAESVSCSANKAQIGHLLGAAGAAELAITCLAIRDGFVPPTLNLDDPDPACDLDGTPHVGKLRDIRAALKLSIGFGGHLAAAVLRRPDGPRRAPSPEGAATP